jgi:hypothetical protein
MRVQELAMGAMVAEVVGNGIVLVLTLIFDTVPF